MLKLLDYGLESESIDRSQQGQTINTGSRTKYEVGLNDARAREIKGILYMYLEDLWMQKTKLRVKIVLSHYLKDKAAQDSVKGKIISIKGYTFGDNSRGTLDIYVAKGKNDQLSLQDIQAREQAMEKQGISYKIVSMSVDYLNDYEYEIKIIPSAFEKEDKQAKSDELMAEIQEVTTLFPERFVANKEFYFGKIMEIHGRHADEMAEAQPPEPEKPKLIETLSYKDAPPDIRRQIEQQAGLTPSTEKEKSPLAPEPTKEKVNLGLE